MDWRRGVDGIGWLARVGLDAVLPPLCLRCRTAVDRTGVLCAGCWGQIRFIGDPKCRICGVPFETAPAGEPVCGGCLADPPRWRRARAAVAYDDASKPLILSFKHGDRLHLAPLFAGWLLTAGAPLRAELDVLVPVPLHRWRLLRRRYNQAAVLARHLARDTGLPVSDRALVRVRPSPSQGHLSAEGRRRNVQGAFAVDPARVAEIRGRRVLLIDDVHTSGATGEACTRALLRAGAETVSFLTIARVLR